jgi:acyl carrier protein
MALGLKCRYGLPYVGYIHGEEINYTALSRELHWLARRVVAGADFLIANSKNTARLVETAWNAQPDRVRLLHPGVNTERFRPAAPDPDAVPAAGKPFAAPRTPDEEALCRIWTEVLSVERVGINDDFFELGGHSLLATQVVSRVRGALGVDLPLRTIFESPTVAGLAEVLERLRGHEGEGEDMTRMLEEIEGLSEEEVQQLLAVEMGQAQT